MGLTTTSPEALYTRIADSYPFHPDLRELVGKFKENEGFQQTRGVIRLMQMVVSDLWTSEKAADLDLIHPFPSVDEEELELVEGEEVPEGEEEAAEGEEGAEESEEKDETAE